jgi:hypothetical protein
MNIQTCSICNASFDFDEEGTKGMIGLIPFAFCATCRAGVWDWAQIAFDLFPAQTVENLRAGLERLASPEAFTVSRPATEEEHERMKFAQKVLDDN